MNTSRTFDEGKDAEEYEAFREHIPEMIAQAVAAVKDAFQKQTLLKVNISVGWTLMD